MCQRGQINLYNKSYFANVCQLIVTSSKITEPLKISKRITRKTAKRAPKTPINTVVPHPGATFPYSEFNGRNKVPSAMLKFYYQLSPYMKFSFHTAIKSFSRSLLFIYSMVNKLPSYLKVSLINFLSVFTFFH